MSTNARTRIAVVLLIGLPVLFFASKYHAGESSVGKTIDPAVTEAGQCVARIATAFAKAKAAIPPAPILTGLSAQESIAAINAYDTSLASREHTLDAQECRERELCFEKVADGTLMQGVTKSCAGEI